MKYRKSDHGDRFGQFFNFCARNRSNNSFDAKFDVESKFVQPDLRIFYRFRIIQKIAGKSHLIIYSLRYREKPINLYINIFYEKLQNRQGIIKKCI